MYKTRQKDIILNYLIQNAGRHISVKDILDYFRQNNIKVGITTVYRQLNNLIETGKIKKYFFDQNSAACFQYINEKCKPVNHYHLKCKLCLKLTHLKCDDAQLFINHFNEKHDFNVDLNKTVFYGICSNCKMKGFKRINI